MRKIFSVLLAFSLAFCSTASVFAADLPDEDGTISIDFETNNGVVADPEEPVEPDDPVDPVLITESNNLYGSKWVEVAHRSNGLNQWLRFTVYSTNSYVHIQMKNSSGTVVWSENNAFRGQIAGGYREFWCGSNICSVELKLANSSETLRPCLTEYGIAHD